MIGMSLLQRVPWQSCRQTQEVEKHLLMTARTTLKGRPNSLPVVSFYTILCWLDILSLYNIEYDQRNKAVAFYRTEAKLLLSVRKLSRQRKMTTGPPWFFFLLVWCMNCWWCWNAWRSEGEWLSTSKWFTNMTQNSWFKFWKISSITNATTFTQDSTWEPLLMCCHRGHPILRSDAWSPRRTTGWTHTQGELRIVLSNVLHEEPRPSMTYMWWWEKTKLNRHQAGKKYYCMLIHRFLLSSCCR